MFGSETPIKNITEFERILRTYTPNLEIIDVLHDSTFVILAAPTAAGRNTIIKNLIMTGKYHYVISDTTRRPRINNGIPERSGEEYWFKTEEEFLYGLKNGAYIEAAIIHNQQVSGISLDEIRRGSDSGRVLITDMDIHGCDTIKSYSDTTIPVFILPPQFDEWMRRLDGRGAMDPAEKHRRLTSAAEEIQLALERAYFKYVINWELKVTIEELHEHIQSRTFGDAEQNAAKSHAHQLLQDLENYLRTPG